MVNSLIIMNKTEILTAALDARIQEVMHYQINIDNYTIALNEIAKLSDEDQKELAEFAQQLKSLLASEKLEQKKAQIMLNVVKQQLE